MGVISLRIRGVGLKGALLIWLSQYAYAGKFIKNSDSMRRIC